MRVRLARTLRSPVAISGLVLTLLGFLKFVSLVSEKHAEVSLSRRDDRELLELCRSGAAGTSAKFRQACVAATSDATTPLLLKAVLSAVRSLFLDFSEAFQSPSRLVLLALFCFSGLALPVVRSVTRLFDVYFGSLETHVGQDEECRIVSVELDEPRTRGMPRWRRGTSRSMSQLFED